jgi:mevalonate kinase
MTGGPFSPTGDETTGFGHGKVILLGEHTVVYGHPALAAGLSLGVRARVAPGTGQLQCAAWSLNARIGDGSDVAQALARIADVIGIDPSRLDVTLDADLPARAGLGSSAATAVAVARAMAARIGIHDDNDHEAKIAAAADAAEAVFHGNPSGVDAAAARHGGVGVFRKATGWVPANVRQPVKLCLGLSGTPRRTADLVGSVGVLVRRSAAARKVVEALADTTEAGIEAVALGDIDSLGRLFDLAHGMLAGLRLSTLEIERLVHGARSAGALGAKLTGAGGGGAVIALAPSHRHDVMDRWQSDGFTGLMAVVGGAK